MAGGAELVEHPVLDAFDRLPGGQRRLSLHEGQTFKGSATGQLRPAGPAGSTRRTGADLLLFLHPKGLLNFFRRWSVS
jgi:hypothetical protein